jgi:hypothetical protein
MYGLPKKRVNAAIEQYRQRIVAQKIAKLAPIASGKSKQIARIGEMPIQLFVYRRACRKPNLLLVFHGS